MTEKNRLEENMKGKMKSNVGLLVMNLMISEMMISENSDEHIFNMYKYSSNPI